MSLWRYANPVEFMRLSGRALPVLWALTAASLGVGLVWGFFLTPLDYEQGSTVKILFIHVPAALMAINAWLMMLVASLIWFIRRHHVSALAARAAAPVGAVFTLITLLTGAIWGQPMWGTWWAWDPRLTSFFILFVFYLGYIGLWEAVEDPEKAADLTAVTCMVGSVFALLSRYAVFFWSQGLHQGAVAVDRPAGERARRVLVSAAPVHGRFRAAVRGAGAGADPHRDPRPAHPRADGAGGPRLMPELGRYAATVLGAYGVTLALLVVLVALTLRRAAKVKRELAAIEARDPRRTDGRP
jgi:heme exporter protein C